MKPIDEKVSTVPYRSIWLTVMVSFMMIIVCSPVAFSQPEDPIPVLDFGESQKAISVGLDFSAPDIAELREVKVFYGWAHGRVGAPPQLSVGLLDLNGNLIERFNAWHPLWTFFQDAEGKDHLWIESEASSEIIFPFSPSVAVMDVTNLDSGSEIISVDLVSSLHDFCRENPSEADCGSIANRPPICSAGGPYVVECAGSSTPLTLDGGNSNDPDDDPLSWAWSGSFSGGAVTGSSPTVQYSLLGTSRLDLTVMDDFGLQSSCTSQVTVQDTTPPAISSNAKATIYPLDAPISFTATASDTCSPTLAVEVTNYKCEMITSKKPKPIDKRESCVVQISGPTITILDSGGVGDRISWTVLARDPSGNVAQTSFYVDVIKPPLP